MAGVPKTTNFIAECDSCGQEMSGYSKKELEDEHGWEWKQYKIGRMFVMCGECVHEYSKRRALKAGA